MRISSNFIRTLLRFSLPTFLVPYSILLVVFIVILMNEAEVPWLFLGWGTLILLFVNLPWFSLLLFTIRWLKEQGCEAANRSVPRSLLPGYVFLIATPLGFFYLANRIIMVGWNYTTMKTGGELNLFFQAWTVLLVILVAVLVNNFSRRGRSQPFDRLLTFLGWSSLTGLLTGIVLIFWGGKVTGAGEIVLAGLIMIIFCYCSIALGLAIRHYLKSPSPSAAGPDQAGQTGTCHGGRGGSSLYNPEPMDVSDIELSKDLGELVEKLARNTHDIWAGQRIRDGWRLGPERSDARKETPCLVDYGELPAEEKSYDREVSAGVIKSMLKMGYVIIPPEKREVLSGLEDEASHLLSVIESSSPLSAAEIFTIWRHRNRRIWQNHPELYLLVGERALKGGEALLAYDILTEGIDPFAGDILQEKDKDDPRRNLYIKLLRKQALSLAQTGAADEARKILEKLIERGENSSETRGLLGRTCKDMAIAAAQPREKRDDMLREAFAIYLQAHKDALADNDIDGAYYNGINAATLAFWSGDLPAGQNLAQTVLDLCSTERARLEKNELAPSYWLYATMGEAELLLGNMAQARDYYRQAAKLTGNSIRDLASMRGQAVRILAEQGEDPGQLDSCFQLPSVVVFSGHPIDDPQRSGQRFPAGHEEQVRQEIARYLDEINAGLAFSSAACGSDIIFLEEMLKREGEINIVLPFEKEHFIRESVEIIPGEGWQERFENVLAKAVRVQILGYYDRSSDNRSNLEFTNLCLAGEARTRSRILGTGLYALAVWDEIPEPTPGSTFSAVRIWHGQGLPIKHINPMAPDTASRIPAISSASCEYPPEQLAGNVAHHTFLPMLFADVKGYSKLSEQEVVRFSVDFLGKVGEITTRHEAGILSKRTAGDGLFLVFRDLRTAINFARDLRDETVAPDWTEFGLPAELLFRISLDAGPCYSYRDPVIGQQEYCGSYVVRAARMEPITPPGQIYASETFVALARATGLDEVQFDYAGQVALPKNYGVIPTFHLR